MKRVFGVKKNKEPPPSIQDASDRVFPLSLSIVNFFIRRSVHFLHQSPCFEAKLMNDIMVQTLKWNE